MSWSIEDNAQTKLGGVTSYLVYLHVVYFLYLHVFWGLNLSELRELGTKLRNYGRGMVEFVKLEITTHLVERTVYDSLFWDFVELRIELYQENIWNRTVPCKKIRNRIWKW